MEQILESYLDRIDRHLRPMAAPERADIIREIHSEMLELEEQGLSPDEIGRRLGPPKKLAAAYLENAITKSPRFSWSRLGALAAFYSMAGLGGMIVLPAASLTALTFMICGVLVPALALLKLLASLVGVDVPWVIVQLGSWSAPPALAYLISAAAGLLLLLGGRACWRFILWFVRMVGEKRKKLA